MFKLKSSLCNVYSHAGTEEESLESTPQGPIK